MSEDWEFEETLRRLVGPVDRRGVWASIEARADKGRQISPPSPRLRTHPLRVAVYASIAVVLVAAITVGSLEAVKHLGGGQPILVITDETTVTSQAETTVTSQAILTLVMDPTDRNILYAGTPVGAFKTTDGAASWQQLPTVPGGAWVIAVDPASPLTVYVDSILSEAGDHKLMRSDDGGATWTDLTNTGTPFINGWLPHFRFDTSSTPSTVYTSGLVDGQWGLWRSADRGVTWIPTDMLPDQPPEPPAVEKARDGFLYVTWGQDLIDADTGSVIHVNQAVTVLDNVLFDPPGTVYLAAREGVYKSVDGGGAWKQANNGLRWK